MRVRGVVTCLKWNYGFLRLVGGPKMLFVHSNEIKVEGRSLVLRPGEGLPDAVQVGQRVELSLSQALVDLPPADFANLKERPAAQNVVMLPREHGGDHAESARIQGTVTRQLQGVKRNRYEGYGGVIKYFPSDPGSQGEASSGDGGGAAEVEGAAPAAAAQFIGFDAADFDDGDAAFEMTGPVRHILMSGDFELGKAGHTPRVGQLVSFVLEAGPPQRARFIQCVSVADPSVKDALEETGLPEYAGQSTGAAPAPPAGGGESQGRSQGVVCKWKRESRFGFIRAVDGEKQIFFHLDEVPAESRETLCVGSEVSFQVGDDYRTGKKIARSLKELPKGTISFENMCGRFTGTVVRQAMAPRSRNVDDGLVQFAPWNPSMAPEGQQEEGSPGAVEGGERAKVEVLFGRHCIDDPRLMLGPGDVVSFDCLQNKATRRRRIARVELVRRAEGHPGGEACNGAGLEQGQGEGEERSPGRSLGRLSNLKKSFGFIRSVTEVADIFFHFDNLQEGVDRSMLSAGLDVEFTLTRDPVNNRTHAVQVSLAPKGAAVFEEVGSDAVRGVVVESASKGQSGLVRAEIDGQTAHLPFSFGEVVDPRMNPRVDEVVQFRVFTDVKRERTGKEAIGKEGLGRRATLVQLAPRAGKVLDIVESSATSYGFIQCKLSAEELAVRLKQPQNFQTDAVPAPAAPIEAAPAAPEGGEAEASPAAPAARALPASTDRGRVFFHETAVLHGVKLSPGDEVEFVLCTAMYKGKYDLNARDVRRTKAAGEVKPEARPDSLKFTGGRKGVSMATPLMRLSKGPDGTPGFHPGRGRRLSPPPGEPGSPPGLALGEAPTQAPPPPTEELAPPPPGALGEAGPAAGDVLPPTSDPPPGIAEVAGPPPAEVQIARLREESPDVVAELIRRTAPDFEGGIFIQNEDGETRPVPEEIMARLREMLARDSNAGRSIPKESPSNTE